VNTPVGATVGRTGEVLNRVREYFETKEKNNVDGMFTVTGFSFSGHGQSSGLAFVHLKDWSCGRAQNRVQAIADRAMAYFSTIKEANDLRLRPARRARTGQRHRLRLRTPGPRQPGHEKLMEARNQILGMAAKDPAFMPRSVRPTASTRTAIPLHLRP